MLRFLKLESSRAPQNNQDFPLTNGEGPLDALAILRDAVGPSEGPPPLKILSVRKRGADGSFRIEAEISWSLIRFLSRLGSAFYPLVGAVEERLERDRWRAERDAQGEDRRSRMFLAGLRAHRQCRKLVSGDGRRAVPSNGVHQSVLESVGQEFGLPPVVVDKCRARYWRWFRPRLKAWRRRVALRLQGQDFNSVEIAKHLKVSRAWVQRELGPEREWLGRP